MKAMEEIRVILRDRNGKKLAALSVGAFLLIAAIVFFATFKLCESIHLKQMNNYLEEIERISESSGNELQIRSRIYEDDVLVHAELGLKIYTEDQGTADEAKLERVRGAVSASSVTLVDGQRQTLATTGVVSPEENYSACVQALEPRALHLELYPALSKDGEKTGKTDGQGFVMLPVPGSASQSLVFEFACDPVLEMYNTLDTWSAMLEHILSAGDAAAFVKTGDQLAGYPMEGLTLEQNVQLQEELMKLFQSSDRFRGKGNESAGRIITLQGRRYLAAMMHYPQDDTDVLLTVPLMRVIDNGIYIAIAISVIIALGIVLIQIYVFRRLSQEKSGGKAAPVTIKTVYRATWPGILVMIAVTLVFSSMLLLLENRSNVAFFTTTHRDAMENEISWRNDQEKTIRSTFTDFYRTRAQMLAAFLTEHPTYQTREGLQELSRIAGSEYLMRFDKTGAELFSSNSYTGFSIGNNLSEDYQAVLLGYPCAVVGPEVDAYTDQTQIGVAVLMMDSEGQPDGFLLAVYSAGDLAAELKRMKPENTVNGFIMQNGHIAALIKDEDGSFIAHTDPQMIGQKAEAYLEDVKPGSSFEGFTQYGGKSVYVSASAADGKTLLFIVPAVGDAYARKISFVIVLAVLLILVAVYYPTTCSLSAQTMKQAREKMKTPDNPGNPMRVFYDGYVIFLTLFAAFALISSFNGWWTSFDYVFSGQWSKGLHLFSLWAALFVLVVTLFCVFLIRIILKRMENRLSLRGKTLIRLTNSLIRYVAIIFLAFCILDMFGVNTTALMASAGIISIAVGMGAQSMAADLLAGFFMMLEGSVQVGDHVSVGGVTGTVTDMGIRTTEITDEQGNVVIFNNSKVTGLSNKSRKPAQREESEPKKES